MSLRNDLRATVDGLRACNGQLEDVVVGDATITDPTEIELVAQLCEEAAELLHMIGEASGFRLMEDDEADRFERQLRTALRVYLARMARRGPPESRP